MKKTLLATTMTLALASTGAMAGGIQIDPTGAANFATAGFVIDPGNSFGNALARDAFGSVTNSGTMFIQNVIDISGTQNMLASSRLIFVMDIPITASGAGIRDFDSGVGSGTGSFSLFYEDATTGGVAAAKGTGTGFTDDILIASGSVTLTPGASFAYATLSPVLVDLDPTGVGPGAVQTIQGTGGSSFDIDFTFKNAAYVVNDVTGLTIDLDIGNTLATPFTGVGVATSSFAEAGAAPGAPNYGTDGVNDFSCGLAVSCDMQYQANTTLNFKAEKVPEPTTLALMGLGLLGVAARRRRKSA